ncbi:MAG: YjaA family stress response protein [Wenzhouxiangellaceae bacterium]
MFDKLLKNTVYLKIYMNRFEMKHIESGNQLMVKSARPFTTERLLVGDFSAAVEALYPAIQQLYKDKWLSPSPVIIVQPMEMIEGGLSQVEDRLLRELVDRIGARKVVVWVGHTLSDVEVNNAAYGGI